MRDIGNPIALEPDLRLRNFAETLYVDSQNITQSDDANVYW